MYKVKLFKDFDSEGNLEKSINSFLENQTPQFELFDIKYNMTRAINGWEKSYIQYTAMVIYYFK
ncbi:sporulation protein Cse60 [uncultured Clostridium sp.]|uniref:sporulation protein Cse60 n=1 Tax=uncultured Clostridium sp. TaxID=59620 RepID=UPI0026318F9C|nr:sporulation protein Cse60 [uncultured Clostridium sp.]